jgi:hypothetical protein
MIVPLGAWEQPETPDDRTVNGGRSLIVFLLLDLGNSKAPGTIEHTLHVLDDKHEAHAVVLAPLVVSNESPIVVAPPPRGEWDSVNNRRLTRKSRRYELASIVRLALAAMSPRADDLLAIHRFGRRLMTWSFR